MIAPDDYGKIDTERMTAVLGYEMQSRGKDATGILTVDPKGRWKLRKKPYPADVFLAGRNGIGVSASTLLLHTRAATQGKSSIPGNNHPIQYGNVIGIHNGVIWNDDKLYDHYKWDRLNQVDSEAIFAALHHLPQADALTNIDGSWATAWVNTEDDPRKLWLARGNQSPMFYALTTNGSVIFASTHSGVKLAMEYGGITGTPNIITAQEGFLAHTDPDEGGLIVEPKFDGSGKEAIGARTWRAGNTYSHAGMYGGGWDNDDWEWQRAANANKDKDKSKPTPNVRIQISGDKANPKVGDRRRYITREGEWIYESCTSVSPPCWAQLHESKVGLAHPTSPGNDPKDAPGRVVSVMTQFIDGQMVKTETLANGNKLITTRQEPVSTATVGRKPIVVDGDGTAERDDFSTNGVVLPFDQTIDPDLVDEDCFIESSDVRYGFANVGDLICLPKSLVGGSTYGGIIGIVTDIDEGSQELHVEWRPGRLDIHAEYEVLIAAQKGT
jgi:hypothetical protein